MFGQKRGRAFSSKGTNQPSMVCPWLWGPIEATEDDVAVGMQQPATDGDAEKERCSPMRPCHDSLPCSRRTATRRQVAAMWPLAVPSPCTFTPARQRKKTRLTWVLSIGMTSTQRKQNHGSGLGSIPKLASSNHHQIMRHGIIITPLGMCHRRCHCLSCATTSGSTRPVWRCFATRENKIMDFLAAREQNGTAQQPGITRYPQAAGVRIICS
jgi:hypothetical protein